jgi:hypothetical protein
MVEHQVRNAKTPCCITFSNCVLCMKTNKETRTAYAKQEEDCYYSGVSATDGSLATLTAVRSDRLI